VSPLILLAFCKLKRHALPSALMIRACALFSHRPRFSFEGAKAVFPCPSPSGSKVTFPRLRLSNATLPPRAHDPLPAEGTIRCSFHQIQPHYPCEGQVLFCFFSGNVPTSFPSSSWPLRSNAPHTLRQQSSLPLLQGLCQQTQDDNHRP